MAPLQDEIISGVAVDLLGCLAAEMAKTPIPPASVCLRYGDSVSLLLSESYDECCAGLAWVRWSRIYPSGQSSFPDADGAVSPCGVARWALGFELGSARCGPTPGASDIPTCDEHVDVAIRMFDDLAAIRRAICCYENMHGRNSLILVSDGAPGTVEGGCVSVTMNIIVSARACDPVCRSV